MGYILQCVVLVLLTVLHCFAARPQGFLCCFRVPTRASLKQASVEFACLMGNNRRRHHNTMRHGWGDGGSPDRHGRGKEDHIIRDTTNKHK